ncbi:sulfatase [Altericroceibacterium endophyticum]|uniref:Sulfatase-like hydrolase/transferase n=1 Tax=Altericroceibacterium endophyticum TaxID=1808508 RepID=A0A6I4T3S4_9SPHN|nr:sulfatase [Altericroceibacterium endophyticum]MXO64939.1 sulfatase-like hydrolase/transferase [Altericroceibacterium endophyticum]
MDRRQILAGLASGASLSLLPSIASASNRPGRKPNFIVIYCDDLGYGDVGAFGGRTIKTPHLDRLARQGMKLTDYYAPANLCTPSRAGFMTGRYPIRTGLARGVIMADEARGLPLSEVTIAEALKPEYATALIGKWHLGHKGPSWPPTKHGFDLFYGIPYSHDMLPLSLYEGRGEDVHEVPFEYPQLQQMFWNRAETFLEDNASRPFFLDLALSAPHLPNYPIPSLAGTSAAGSYGDVVEEIDQIVGRLIDKLDRLGIAEDTMLIFTSDNGPWFEGSAGGLRDRKGGGAYDGGYRVPCIVRQPGTVPSGVSTNAITMGIDFLPTFCAMAGKQLPRDTILDGKDISAVLTRAAPSPHQELVLFDNEEVVGIRTQRWKYVIADYYRTFKFSVEDRGYPQLYDMTDPDMSESYSVASLHKDALAMMKARLETARTTFEPLKSSPGSDIFLRPGERPPSHKPAIWQD